MKPKQILLLVSTLFVGWWLAIMLTACGETSTTEPTYDPSTDIYPTATDIKHQATTTPTYNVTIARARVGSCEYALSRASGKTPYDYAFSYGYAVGYYDPSYTMSILTSSTTASDGARLCDNYILQYNTALVSMYSSLLSVIQTNGVGTLCTNERTDYDYHCIVQRND